MMKRGGENNTENRGMRRRSEGVSKRVCLRTRLLTERVCGPVSRTTMKNSSEKNFHNQQQQQQQQQNKNKRNKIKNTNDLRKLADW